MVNKYSFIRIIPNCERIFAKLADMSFQSDPQNSPRN